VAKPEPERLDAWRGLTALHTRIAANLDSALRAERDLTLALFEVLDALVVLGGKAGAGVLAERLAANASSLTRRIDRLEGDGLVKRLRSNDDGRYVTIQITREGRDTHRTASTTWRRTLQRDFAQHLAEPDVAAITRVAGKLNP
jgi:DNA-binding MarR family transcriptional regulator